MQNDKILSKSYVSAVCKSLAHITIINLPQDHCNRNAPYCYNDHQRSDDATDNSAINSAVVILAINSSNNTCLMFMCATMVYREKSLLSFYQALTLSGKALNLANALQICPF